ncbi:MAG TPA: chromosome segregation protein SMC [Alphaproteobacteria bacterium]|nr:chromosome segregation protein SMC [Alphaproteobacteria bacterium]
MIQFKKLRLNGFKSFVDRTELEISTGLTGIVGPNGCGKSNLTEALRWVMGETSAKRMRGGGGMEDVIFNGTDNRPPRNFAEVSLLLDNSDHSAPAAYNGEEEIEIVRKIEKDKGSLYKVNGKTQRARDVQMLFADTVTGANSPALVSQGRVTEMINAKPQDRRKVLEESAGVSGLYVRRHEAELRLRAADANLQRVEDLVGSMEGRLGALKKQARQAIRYKELSTQIRELETSIAYLEWRLLVNKIEQAKAKFGDAESIVAERMATVTQLTKTQNAQAEELPALRQKEAESSAALQSQKLTLQRIEDQEKAIQDQLTEVREQLERLVEDRDHEKASLEENSATLGRLKSEEETLQNSEGSDKEILEEKTAIKERLEKQVSELEQEYESFMEKVAESRASRQTIERQIAADTSRLSVSMERKEKLEDDLKAAQESFQSDNVHESLKTEILSLEKEVTELREKLTAAEETLESANKAVEEAREQQQKLDKIESEIMTEIKTLETVLDSKNENTYKPVLSDVEPDKGFETALSRALGDTLMASTDDEAPMVWTDRDFNPADFPALPPQAKILEPHVKAPKHLKAALSLIGVVESNEDGKACAAQLKPGQSIVSLEGAYWRWDGLHIKATASDRHALQLQQTNRLKELKERLPQDQNAAEQAREKLAQAQSNKSEKQEALESLQSQTRTQEQSLGSKQSELSRLTEQRSGLFAEIAKLEESLVNTNQDIQDLESSLAENKKSLETYDEDSIASQNEQVEALRNKLTAVRDNLREAVREFDNVQQEQSRRKGRLHAIADEIVNLQNRIIRSQERLKELESREEQLTEKQESLKNAPKTMGSEREELMSKIAELEAKRNEDAGRLAVVENELADTNKALKEAENVLTEAREARAHAQATASAGQEQLDEIVAQIVERFEKQPEALIGETNLKLGDEQELPAIEPLKEQKEKLVRSRDMIGPVNLRAEQEATELEGEVGGMLEERNDLIQAIAELREGIEKLNVEARERLMNAFDHVNGHFQKLFVQLYGGGSAHLKLIESDDPLNSGLEIFAQPPGKTLQSLSLLSGGEQTLASIALIFAMFLTNPSPICVLDEIDAPLDDANVDRVCDLLEEIAERGETRFLVITHHRLTMARMDRLYGVTMAERGVSQLVSVDLNQQLDFLEAAE